MKLNESFKRAIDFIDGADGVLVLAGAGMGADSGLPMFRSDNGFWNAYPGLKNQNLRFVDMANPSQFMKEPYMAWGFYGHRMQLYRQTRPHLGFDIIKKWAETLNKPVFVVTTNVDGHFQKAGFPEENIWEIHGSIHWLQCHSCEDIWRADLFKPKIDNDRCQWLGSLPSCPSCAGIARPNILMFSDISWHSGRSDKQMEKYFRWLMMCNKRVVLEIGAGSTIKTLAGLSNKMHRKGHSIIKINPESGTSTRAQQEVLGFVDSDDEKYVSISMKALDALAEIDIRLSSKDR